MLELFDEVVVERRALVFEHVVSKEFVEPPLVYPWMSNREHVSVLSVQYPADASLNFLLRVPCLKVIYYSQMVHVLVHLRMSVYHPFPRLGDVPIPVLLQLFQHLTVFATHFAIVDSLVDALLHGADFDVLDD